MSESAEVGDRLPSLGPRGQGWVVLQFIGLAAVTFGLFRGGAWSGTARAVTSVLGAGLGPTGFVLAGAALRDLGASLTANPRPKDDATLVEHGVFARARHQSTEA